MDWNKVKNINPFWFNSGMPILVTWQNKLVREIITSNTSCFHWKNSFGPVYRCRFMTYFCICRSDLMAFPCLLGIFTWNWIWYCWLPEEFHHVSLPSLPLSLSFLSHHKDTHTWWWEHHQLNLLQPNSRKTFPKEVLNQGPFPLGMRDATARLLPSLQFCHIYPHAWSCLTSLFY